MACRTRTSSGYSCESLAAPAKVPGSFANVVPVPLLAFWRGGTERTEIPKSTGNTRVNSRPKGANKYKFTGETST